MRPFFKKSLSLFILLPLLLSLDANSQNSESIANNNPVIRLDKINIARDAYGVPHIFAPTDPEVAYGLAWAHAEDDFTTIQTLLLSGKGKLSS